MNILDTVSQSFNNLLLHKDKCFKYGDDIEYTNVCQQINGFVHYHAVLYGMSFSDAMEKLILDGKN